MALLLKEEGNKAFKEQNYVKACKSYSKAIAVQQGLGEGSDSETMVALLSNRAAVYLKVRINKNKLVAFWLGLELGL
jgi:hypothetical protein